MNILIIGASGLLGMELHKVFSNGENSVVGTYKDEKREGMSHLDLLDKEEIKERVGKTAPEIILLPAAITGVDFCEQNQDLAWRVNVEGVKEAAVTSKRLNSFLVFYSTDYIFDGKTGPYSEEALPRPINFYGRTKLEAERIIEKELKRFLIIRTCSIYGYEAGGKNFAMQILGTLRGKKSVRAAKDQFGTPTYVEDLADITFKLVGKRKNGTWNAAGPDYVNRVQFSTEVAEVFNLDKGLIMEVSSKELQQPAERPKRGGLKIDKLRLEAGIKTMSLKEGLLAMKKMEREIRDYKGK